MKISRRHGVSQVASSPSGSTPTAEAIFVNFSSRAVVGIRVIYQIRTVLFRPRIISMHSRYVHDNRKICAPSSTLIFKFLDQFSIIIMSGSLLCPNSSVEPEALCRALRDIISLYLLAIRWSRLSSNIICLIQNRSEGRYTNRAAC